MSASFTQQPGASAAHPGVGHIPSLDGIRALSFLIVFLAHAGLERWIAGSFGLSVFFFLSGYLITTLLRVEWDRTHSIDLRNFYLRRVVRIFPPFYLVLGIASLLTLTGVFEGSIHPPALLAQTAHWSNYYIIEHDWWTGRAPGTWVYWSLAVEEHFYLVFPLAYLLLRRHIRSARAQLLVMAGVCALVLAWRCMLIFGMDVSKYRVYLATDTRIDSILFGCMLAVYGNPVLDASRISARSLHRLWVPLGIILLAVSFAIRSDAWEQTIRYTLQGLGLMPLFVAAIRFHDRGLYRWLNYRWIKHLGVLSYSLYLMHTTVLYAFVQWTTWHPIVQGGVAFGISLLLAEVIYHLVESPCTRLRKRLSRSNDLGTLESPASSQPVGGGLDGAIPTQLIASR